MMRDFRIVPLLICSIFLLAACSGSSSDQADGTSADDVSSVVTTPFIEITANHVDPPVSFETSPSTGGDHFAFWHSCGFYTEELIEGAATHSMEHGAVWITYNDQVSDDDLAELELLAAANPRVLISPYDHDETIVLSAWGAQQRGIASATAPEVAAFITEWLDNPLLVEAGASCSNAVGVPPDSPNMLVDGTPVPDEFLS